MDTIVVGVDTSEGADGALAWALREAAAHGARVIVVMAYDYLNQPHVPEARGFDPDFSEADAGTLLDQILQRVGAAVGAPADAVEVDQRVILDLPVRALVETSQDADLLVVGSRGLGGFTGLLLGSVSQQCLHHAAGPVVVTPAE